MKAFNANLQLLSQFTRSFLQPYTHVGKPLLSEVVPMLALRHSDPSDLYAFLRSFCGFNKRFASDGRFGKKNFFDFIHPDTAPPALIQGCDEEAENDDVVIELFDE
ncbi:unnamed protein product [Soboliphyme baturini]|uniref:HECT domain-containing protein n=1 Tax=Soboliphyme baturini TaxID=241478 RepID=A0A183IHR9_9BILA|nr:unnamed protein product [Soboliphyme baturini]